MFEEYKNIPETDILNNEKLLPILNSLLRIRQFSEEFLSKTPEYYDSWICLKTQKNLSPYFCFRYLYDNDTDSADNWTDFSEIVDYLNKQDKIYSKEEIDIEFNKAMFNLNKKN